MSHHDKGEHGRGQEKQAGGGAADDGARGRSESSPGHLKKAAGAQSARDFAPGRSGDAPGRSGDAPGRSGDAPGRVGRDPGEGAMETPEADSLVREP